MASPTRASPPLFAAVKAGDLATCAELLTTGADVMATVNNDRPLFIAVEAGHVEVCELLLRHGATQDPLLSSGSPYIYRPPPLFIAASKGFTDVCRVLLDHGATHGPDASNTTPLCEASKNGHADVCRLLLSRGAQHTRNPSPIHIAAMRGHMDVCRVLAEYGATHEKDNGGYTPLSLAIRYDAGNETYRALLDGGAMSIPIGPFNRTPLHDAAEKGNVELCRMLHSRGFRHNADKRRATPLHLAAIRGHDIVSCFLLDTVVHPTELCRLIVEELDASSASAEIRALRDHKPLSREKFFLAPTVLAMNPLAGRIMVKTLIHLPAPPRVLQHVARLCIILRTDLVALLAATRLRSIFSMVETTDFGGQSSDLVALVHSYNGVTRFNRWSILASLRPRETPWQESAICLAAAFVGKEVVDIARERSSSSLFRAAVSGCELYRLRSTGRLPAFAWKMILRFLWDIPSYWFATGPVIFPKDIGCER